MVTANRKAKDTEESKLLPELRDLNRKARTSEDPEKVLGFHKACAILVKRMGKEGGVVGNAFRELEYTGKGKPGDEICKLTGRYARKVIKEESSTDIQDVIAAEKLEGKIRTKAEERRLEEKAKERQYGIGEKRIELAKDRAEDFNLIKHEQEARAAFIKEVDKIANTEFLSLPYWRKFIENKPTRLDANFHSWYTGNYSNETGKITLCRYIDDFTGFDKVLKEMMD